MARVAIVDSHRTSAITTGDQLLEHPYVALREIDVDLAGQYDAG
jgi:hypothetical protein